MTSLIMLDFFVKEFYSWKPFRNILLGAKKKFGLSRRLLHNSAYRTDVTCLFWHRLKKQFKRLDLQRRVIDNNMKNVVFIVKVSL